MPAPNDSIIKPQVLQVIFSKNVVEQEFSSERFIKIPGELRELCTELSRPTPLLRAKKL